MAIIAYNIFKWIFMNKKFRILIQISLQFVPKCAIDNKSALVKVMIWCQTGEKPLTEPMLTQLSSLNDAAFLTHVMDWILEYVILNFSHANATELLWWWVTIGSGNDLVPYGTKPLPESMLTQIYVAIWRR